MDGAHPAARLAGGRGRRGPTAAEQAEAADTTARRRPPNWRNAPMLRPAYAATSGAPSQWWQQQVVLGLSSSGFPAPSDR